MTKKKFKIVTTTEKTIKKRNLKINIRYFNNDFDSIDITKEEGLFSRRLRFPIRLNKKQLQLISDIHKMLKKNNYKNAKVLY